MALNSGASNGLVAATLGRAARHPHATAALIALACFAVSLAIGVGVLQRFPNSGDEYASLFQAWTYAAGRFWNTAPPLPEFFETNYISVDRGRAFGVFPPGWPLVLAGAARVGIAGWLVNPALGALTIWLVYLIGRRLDGAREGLVAAALVAVSPFFLFNTASYFAHPLCGVAVLSGVLAAMRYAERGRPLDALLLGLSLGAAVLTRYYTGALCAFPMLLIVARPLNRFVRAVPWIVIGGLPFAGFLLFYNQAVSGSVWRLSLSGVSLYRDHWFAGNWFLRGFDMLGTHLLRYVLWTPPAFIFVAAGLAVAEFRARSADGSRRLDRSRGALVLAAAALVIGMFPYIDRGGNQYGPRYYYEAFPLLAVFVVSVLSARLRGCFEPSAVLPARRLAAVLGASVALVVPLTTFHVWQESRVVHERTDVYRQADRAGLRNAVVLLSGRVGRVRSMPAADLTRNGITWDAPVLYALDRGPDNAILGRRFPDRTLYRYEYDRAAGTGRLVVIDAVRPDREPSGPRIGGRDSESAGERARQRTSRAEQAAAESRNTTSASAGFPGAARRGQASADSASPLPRSGNRPTARSVPGLRSPARERTCPLPRRLRAAAP
jgi:hypothetical protein